MMKLQSVVLFLQTMMMGTLIKIWKYSLGSFSDDKTEPYDNVVAIVRTVIFVSYLVTNCFIISGVIRHWNNNSSECRNAHLDSKTVLRYTKYNYEGLERS